MRHSSKSLDSMLIAEWIYCGQMWPHVSVSLRGIFSPKVCNKMERAMHQRPLLEYAHKDVHRHTLRHLILQAFSRSESANKNQPYEPLIISQKIQSINYNQQRHKAIIATKEFQSSPDAKMISWTLNSFLSTTHFSRSVFPQKMLKGKKKKKRQISLYLDYCCLPR